MTRVERRENESRKDYEVRVAIKFLEENADHMDTIIYDGVECDAWCLAEDLKNTFNMYDEDM